MNNQEIKSMGVEDLWTLREKITFELIDKIAAEKAQLDRRLQRLSQSIGSEELPTKRRAYPQVYPKYANPAQPGETWSGRGKQPRWLSAQLRSGKNLDEFRIQPH